MKNISKQMLLNRKSFQEKKPEIFPCRTFLSCVVHNCLSKCPNSKKLPWPEEFLVRRLNPNFPMWRRWSTFFPCFQLEQIHGLGICFSTIFLIHSEPLSETLCFNILLTLRKQVKKWNSHEIINKWIVKSIINVVKIKYGK